MSMSMKSKIDMDRYVGGPLIFVLNIVARLLGRILHRDHALSVRGDITVIKMLGGGSLVIAMPALLGIRRKYPDIKIRLLTTSGIKQFAETLGVFDEILCLDDQSLIGLVISWVRSLRTCFRTDTVIDLEVYSYLSSVIGIFTFARNRLGFFFEEAGFRQKLHSHRVLFHPGSPLYSHYDRVASMLGADIVPPAACADHLRATLGIVQLAPRSSTGRIAVGCGCSDLSEERKLAPAQWSQYVFATSADRDREVIFLGSSDDAAEIAKVIAAVQDLGNGGWPGKLVDLSGTMLLRESLQKLAECDEFWGIDSSLLHYARLFGLRIKAFLGPTHPMRLRHIEGLKETIYYRKTLCSPCIHLVSVPPCHGDNRCMKWLFAKPGETQDEERWLPVVT